jgi:hypothetical protein
MTLLRFFAVLFGLLALSIFLNPFGLSTDSGVVFLGKRLSGAPNLIAAWCFAVFLACYAISLWREKAAALPLGIAYAAYLHVNLHYALLFTFRDAEAPFDNAHVFAISTIVALVAAWGAVAAMVRGRLAERDHAPARILLRSFALLFALMALANALKPFAYAPDVGFIFFGHRLAGTANTIVALIFSALLATYAASIWAERRRALLLGTAYAIYVLANVVLWNKNRPEQADMSFIFALPYLLGAIGVPSAAALLLWQQRERLA